jgi:hypothetical protein
MEDLMTDLESIRDMAGPEPVFDSVMADFLWNNHAELQDRLGQTGLLEAVHLGRAVPWLWRLTFHTLGLLREEDGVIRPVDRHVIALRFLPDYLRWVNRYQMLALIEPSRAFHPNLRDGHICLELYPGEQLVEICEAIHALLSWRLRQLSEPDALNAEACVWGRTHLDELPLDTRPLFGRALAITLEPVEARS